MTNKSYQTPEDEPMTVGEPAVAYGKISSSNAWNPNVPFHGTQEEYLASRAEDLIQLFHTIDYDSDYTMNQIKALRQITNDLRKINDTEPLPVEFDELLSQRVHFKDIDQ